MVSQIHQRATIPAQDRKKLHGKQRRTMTLQLAYDLDIVSGKKIPDKKFDDVQPKLTFTPGVHCVSL
ncbi:hypothetical protein TNCV_711641 [Trichonephila clavipes]|nr:hypothetical protein TNCV_711641 [Trichonephila clavipes]